MTNSNQGFIDQFTKGNATMQPQGIFQSEDIIAKLRENLILEKFNLSSLALFGSTARNQATEASDIDFIVEFEGSINFDRYMDLKIFLEDLFNKKIDLVIKNSLKPQIFHKVLAEAIYVA